MGLLAVDFGGVDCSCVSVVELSEIVVLLNMIVLGILMNWLLAEFDSDYISIGIVLDLGLGLCLGRLIGCVRLTEKEVLARSTILVGDDCCCFIARVFFGLRSDLRFFSLALVLGDILMVSPGINIFRSFGYEFLPEIFFDNESFNFIE